MSIKVEDAAAAQPETKKPSPLREIVQPFIDLVHAPRALWGINAAYLLEGMVYFGMVMYLAMYFNEYVGLNDHLAGISVGVLTSGITIAMFFLGGVADRWGVRKALLAAFCFMIVGRASLSVAPGLGLASGLFSPIHWIALAGILFIVVGYGMYQPAAYAGVRQFTTPKTAAMGFAMLYALMNLGGWLPTFFAPIRKSVGISGSFWVFTAASVLALGLTAILLTRSVVERATAHAKAEKERAETEEERDKRTAAKQESDREKEKVAGMSFFARAVHWIRHHPLANPKFSFFIFALIPVQTLFAHNWLTLPMYVSRAYKPAVAAWGFGVDNIEYDVAMSAASQQGNWSEILRLWVGENFEVAVNFNPLLIFILVPIVTAVTQKTKVYNMMIVGTFVMAAPTFLLAIGASFWTLLGYILIMTLGEAMWQPRFLQYAAEIAPEGRTGAYMGIAQFPWFLTKMIVPLYSGWFLSRYVPDEGPVNSEAMWLIYGIIAVSSTVMLVLAKGWIGKEKR